MLGRETVGELAGAVGRAVVDHEHAVAFAEHLRECRRPSLEVLELVVGRQADRRAHPAVKKCGANAVRMIGEVSDRGRKRRPAAESASWRSSSSFSQT